MATETTDILSLPYIMPSQAQKHVTHNEAIATLDVLVQAVVADEVAAPPDAPEPGDRVIVTANPTGAFAGKANAIAVWRDGGWAFLAPQTGWAAYDRARQRVVVFTGTVWEELQPPSALAGLATVGINATADAGNRLAVASPSSLFNHEGTDHRLKVNKAAEADTASLLYQTGYSGRAEMGLAGSDDFAIKVSADGANWIEAMTIDGTTGRPSFPQGVAGLREMLAANHTLYVRKTGSDSHDGQSSGTAFLTIQKAVNLALALDMSIYSMTIDVGAGTFAEGNYLNIVGNGNARITIQGAGYDQTTITGAAYAVKASAGAYVVLKDVDCLGVSVGIWATSTAIVTLDGTVRLSGGSARLLGADKGGAITSTTATIRINSDTAYVLYATYGGLIQFASTMTVAIAKDITVSVVAKSQSLGMIYCQANSVTWDTAAGSVTGSRYAASLNGIIDTITGGGPDYFPGTAGGAASTGGQYA